MRDVEETSADQEMIDAERFHAEFLKRGVPLILRGGAKTKLRAFERWTDDYLLKHIPDATRVAIDVPGASEATTTFAKLWECFTRSFSSARAETVESFEDSLPRPPAARPALLRLADLRLRDCSPILVRDASPLPLPCSDLLSELPRHIDPGYLWIFAGHEGSGTRLHRDVLGTHGWIAQLRGKKRVRIFAKNAFEPGEHKNIDVFAPSSSSSSRRLPICREALLTPGDVLFIPAMMWHQDRNENGSFGITGNFCEPTILTRTIEIARALHENDLADALTLLSRSVSSTRREGQLVKVASTCVDEAHLQ